MSTLPIKNEVDIIIINEETTIIFLKEEGIVIIPAICPSCPGTLIRSRVTLRCTRSKCRITFSIFKNTFFSNMRIKCNAVIFITYLYLSKVSTTSILTLTGHSSKTVCNIIKRFKDALSRDFNSYNEKIGGKGIIVEIDESKFGKRKYNRRHRVEGVWVLGGIERTSEKKVFLIEVPNRRATTLLKVIKKICEKRYYDIN